MRLWTFQSKEAADALLNDKCVVPRNNNPDISCLGVVRCFCKLGTYKSLSLAVLLRKYDYLSRFYGLGSTGGVMLELEVPEDQILVTSIENGTAAVVGNHLEFMRGQNCSLNTCMFLIRPEWVVAIREVSSNAFADSCRTVYVNEELVPAWKGDILFNYGFPIEQVHGEYHYLLGVDRDRWLKEHCPNEAPYYYTKAESDEFCGLNGM